MLTKGVLRTAHDLCCAARLAKRQSPIRHRSSTLSPGQMTSIALRRACATLDARSDKSCILQAPRLFSILYPA